MTWLRTELDAAGRQEQDLLVVGDGSYDTAGLWTSLPERTVLLARTARTRALFAVPHPEPKRRGAPRKYGERARPPAAQLQENRGWEQTTLAVRGRRIPTRYRVEGPFVVRTASSQPVFLVVVPGIDRRVRRHRRQRDLHFWLVNASKRGGEWVLPLPAEELGPPSPPLPPLSNAKVQGPRADTARGPSAEIRLSLCYWQTPPASTMVQLVPCTCQVSALVA
jgi:hypothetical protein